MRWLERIESWVDRSIPYALLVLLALLIVEFTVDTAPYRNVITIIDETIFVLFIADLCFKYRHVRKLSKFVKLYWLEIIAVFPFYLIIRAYTTLLELSKGIEETQKVLHETTLLKETLVMEEARAFKNIRLLEEEARLAREGKLLRTTRIIQRGIRLLYVRLLFAYKSLFHRQKRNKKE